MLAKLRPHLTYANVMATIAVFIALGGTSAYAINEWTGANIVNESLTGADVKGRGGTSSTPAVNGSLGSVDIGGQAANPANGTPFVDGSLTGVDVRDNALKGADIDESTLTSIGGGGPAGGDLTGSYPNPQIAPDVVGASEIAPNSVGPLEFGFINTIGLGKSIPPGGGVGEVIVTCPEGLAISGGASFDFPSGDISVSRRGAGQSWVAEGQNNGNLAQDLSAWVSCLFT